MATLVLRGIVGWDITSPQVRGFLSSTKDAQNTIVLTTPGGSIFEAFNIYNAIREHKGDLKLVLDGLVASAGSYILSAFNGVGREIEANDNSVVMAHNGLAPAYGDHRAHRKIANILENLTNILAQALCKRTKKKMEDVRALMDEETFYYAEEIVKQGFADKYSGKQTSEVDALGAVTTAQMEIKACVSKMEQDESYKDKQKFVALLDEVAGSINKLQEIENKEKPSMENFFKNNPEAKAAFDKLVEAKTDEILKARTGQIPASAPVALAAVVEPQNKVSETDITKLRNIMVSNSYPDSVRNMAVDVMAGKQPMAVLDAVVAAADTIIEMTKSQGAQNLSRQTPTAGNAPSPVTGDGIVNYNSATAEGEVAGTVQTMADVKAATDFLKSQV